MFLDMNLCYINGTMDKRQTTKPFETPYLFLPSLPVSAVEFDFWKPHWQNKQTLPKPNGLSICQSQIVHCIEGILHHE